MTSLGPNLTFLRIPLYKGLFRWLWIILMLNVVLLSVMFLIRMK